MGSNLDTDHCLDPIQLLELLRPPIGADGQIILPATLSKRLKSIASAAATLPFPGLVAGLRKAAELLPAHDPTAADNPTYGHVGTHPLWSFCISMAPDKAHRLESIRALAIVTRWVAPIGEIDWTNDFRTAVEQLEQLTNPDQVSLVAELASVTSNLSTAKLAELDGVLRRLQHANLLRSSRSDALSSLIRRAAKHAGAALPRRKHEPLEPPPQLHLQEDLTGVLEPPPTPTVAIDPEDEPTAIVLCPSSVIQPSRVLNDQRLRESGYLIATQLSPNSPRALLAVECQEFVDRLMPIAERADLPLVDREAAIIWVLVLISSRGYSDLTGVLTVGGSDSAALAIDSKYRFWTGAVPNADRFWKPDEQQDEVFTSSSARVRAAIPDRVRRALEGICAPLLADRRLFRSRPNELRVAGDRLLKEAREVLPRLAETRLRLSLPSTLLAQSGEPCVSQIFAGTTFGMSGAPLHYYSAAPSELHDHYSQAVSALTGMGFDEPAAPGPGEPRVGARICGVQDQQIVGFVSDLRRAVLNAAQKSRLDDRLRQYLNALSEYSCWMVAAAVAHRATNSLGSFTLQDMDPRGFGVFDDKQPDAHSSHRIAAFPEMVVQQIGALRRELIDAADQLKDQKALQKVLRRRASGDEPLFQLIGEDYTSTLIDMSALKERWLKPRGLPPNILRSRLRMKLTSQGLHSEYIYCQLGHQYNGITAFGAEYGISIPEFVGLAAPKMQQVLLDDGWRVLPAVSARVAKPDWVDVPGLSHDYLNAIKKETSDLAEQWATARDRLDLFRRPPRDAYVRRDSWIRETLSRFETVAISQNADLIEITPDQIAAALEGLIEQRLPTNQVLLFMTGLKWALRRRYRTGRWRGALPPSALWRRFLAPPVLKAHLAAGVALGRLRTWACGVEESCKDAAEIRAHLAVVLVSDGLIDSPERLEQLVSTEVLTKAVSFAPDPSRLVAEWTDGRSRQSVILSGEASALAQRLQNLKSPESLSLAKALMSHLPAAERPASERLVVSRLVNLGLAGIRTWLPGTFWSTLTTPASICLDQERTRHWVHNELAPAATEEDEDAEALLGEQDLREASRSSSARVSMQQFRKLTGELHRYSERGNRTGVLAKRYANTRKFTKRMIDDPATDPNVRLIARFALADLTTSPQLRIRQVHEHVTTFGKRLLHAASGIDLTLLDEESLEEVYNTTLELASSRNSPLSSEYLGRISSQLLRFHQHNEERLADIDLSQVNWHRASSIDAARIEVVTPAELEMSIDLSRDAIEQGILSPKEGSYAEMYFRLMCEGGTRCGEVTHLQVGDVYRACGRVLVYIRNSRVGLVKTRSSVRVLDATDLLGVEKAEALFDLRKERLSLGATLGKPLFDFDEPNRLLLFLRTLRMILRAATGNRASSLHSLRHSFASRRLQLLQSKAPVATESVSLPLIRFTKIIGHSALSTSLRSYAHVNHLALASRAPTRFDSLRAEARLRGIKENTLLQRSRRSRATATDHRATAATVLDRGTERATRFTKVREALRGRPGEMLKALLRLRLSDDVSVVLGRLPLSRQQFSATVEMLVDLKHVRSTRLLEDEQYDQLMKVAELRECAREWTGLPAAPRSRQIEISRLQLRRALKSSTRPYLSWSTTDLRDCIQARTWPSPTPWQKQLCERALEAGDDPAVDFKLAATLVWKMAGSG